MGLRKPRKISTISRFWTWTYWIWSRSSNHSRET